MSKIKLTTYLNKIESKYIKAREDWENLQKELKEEETRYQNIKWINLSPQGKIEEQNAHIKKNREISQRLEQIRKDFDKSASDIVKDSDKVFNRAYQYTSEDVDMNGVAILQNGNMNDKELMELAESYRLKGNNTMYFMVAEKLKHDKPFEMLSDTEREAEGYWREAHRRRTTREDHECFDGFRDICLKALRDEGYLSNGIHKQHDSLYQRYKDFADGVEVEAPSPWED